MPHVEPTLPSDPVDSPRPAATATYSERLSPGIWTYGAIALFCVFVFVMIVIASLPIAAAVSLALLAAGSVFAFVTSPVVTVADGQLQAGRARIPVTLLSEPRTLDRVTHGGVDLILHSTVTCPSGRHLGRTSVHSLLASKFGAKAPVSSPAGGRRRQSSGA